MQSYKRRDFLARLGVAGVGFFGLSRCVLEGGPAAGLSEGYGGLVPDPEELVDLPAGFSYTVISSAGEQMDDGLYVPPLHDGMAAFSGPSGQTLLVRNHEVNSDSGKPGAFGDGHKLLRGDLKDKLYDRGNGEDPGLGGTTTLVFDTRTQRLEQHSLSLAGTIRNCAGGPTPWGSWISCEETVLRKGDPFERDHGYCFEVPASATPGVVDPVALKAMGRFNHEAIAVHEASGTIYLTEDRGDGIFYRFLPNVKGEPAKGGRLQALALRDLPEADARNWEQPVVKPGVELAVRWIDIENVESPEDELREQGHSIGACRFARGEGIWTDGDRIYFACTDGGAERVGQVFRYFASAYEGTPEEEEQPGRLELFLEPNDTNLLEYADNLTIAPWGDVILCEDGSGVDRVLGVTPQGRIYLLARNARNDSEFAGATFAPDGSTLFVNMQGLGLTLAITGLWARRAS